MLWLCPGSLRCLDKRALTRYINIAQAPGVDCFRLNQKKKTVGAFLYANKSVISS